MEEYMVTENAANIYKKVYALSARDHHYPAENVVRLTKWFFDAPYGSVNKGKCLDYGCGSSENMQHLIRSGFEVSGVEIASEALDECRRKLEKFEGKYSLHLLKPSDKELPFPDNTFDCILANGVIHHAGSLRGVKYLLGEFKRVLKPSGKIIAAVFSRFNSACIDGTMIGDGVYEWKGHRVYILKDENHVRAVFDGYFQINEIGYLDHYYFNNCGHHWVILATNSLKER